ncbi:hypothetical protein B0H15DRAFT_952466 [Mycena belliarum]|uniref:Uncharacterized protein n=1 Tax=Mycena belliarum TaxID=1033014 RepID=A0AAD6XJ53_9AGAR|nr:hypothetical protein B0H15DRAFT_952466 [Mycena belliae]
MSHVRRGRFPARCIQRKSWTLNGGPSRLFGRTAAAACSLRSGAHGAAVTRLRAARGTFRARHAATAACVRGCWHPVAVAHTSVCLFDSIIQRQSFKLKLHLATSLDWCAESRFDIQPIARVIRRVRLFLFLRLERGPGQRGMSLWTAQGAGWFVRRRPRHWDLFPARCVEFLVLDTPGTPSSKQLEDTGPAPARTPIRAHPALLPHCDLL